MMRTYLINELQNEAATNSRTHTEEQEKSPTEHVYANIYNMHLYTYDVGTHDVERLLTHTRPVHYRRDCVWRKTQQPFSTDRRLPSLSLSLPLLWRHRMDAILTGMYNLCAYLKLYCLSRSRVFGRQEGAIEHLERRFWACSACLGGCDTEICEAVLK